MVIEMSYYLFYTPYNFEYCDTLDENWEALDENIRADVRCFFTRESINRYKRTNSYFLKFISDVQNIFGWNCYNERIFGRERVFK